ncbi:MAG: DUF3575 domain-containing protein [Rikenellaceae bacterium]
MKKIILIFAILMAVKSTTAQTYLKLNSLYALVGIVNPSVEMPLSTHWTYNAEMVYSPWKGVKFFSSTSQPFEFGMFMNEVRWHPKGNYNGWFIGPNAGMQAFYMAKDKGKNCKGWGVVMGGVVGYQWEFGKNKRWMLEGFFGGGWQHSWYVGYSPTTGEEIYPYNKSGEWLPYKIGLNIGYKIFKGDNK